jgi:hypothetical protein
MNLYEVLFYDTRDRSSDTDMIFLVRAPDFQAAIEEALKNGAPEHRSRLPHSAFELGTEVRTRFNLPEVRVLRGPYFECGFNFGWREWRRDTQEGPWNEGWQEEK